MRPQFFLIICLFTLLNLNTRTNAALTTARGGNETDHLALFAFKSKIMHDPQSTLKSWNNSLHFCDWKGVFCGRKHRRVTKIDLSSTELVGSLSPHIGNMSFLKEINLQNNTLLGEIPSEVGRLFRLQYLLLNNNSFEGEIPANISHCSNLVLLTVANNKLGGKIPVELTYLSKLVELYLHKNFLTGGIPAFVGNLTSLESFSVRTNMLGGNIPDAFGQLKSLLRFGLSENNLSGMIPQSMYNLSSVTIFSLSENRLHGTIPGDIGLTLPSLEWLQIWGNYLSGTIPVSLSNVSSLQLFDLGDNNFTGKIEVHFGKMQQLWRLRLSSNMLGRGEVDELDFVSSLKNCSNLKILYLDDNRLEGVLPNSIANLSTQLQVLSIGINRISGGLPFGIKNLVNLTSLELQNNLFSGSIPWDFGHLQSLQMLSLSHNMFSGEIPSFLGNLSRLNKLYLDDNQFRGTIPSSLRKCQNLLLLNLSRNNLSDAIPKELFDIHSLSISLNLAQNSLVGPLPLEIGNLFNLNELDVSQNKLSGKIPKNLDGCESLESLYMEKNKFEGNIPSLVSLRGLKNLDLSQNNLSGEIPKYLENFALVYLNLSFNILEGDVPVKGVFANKSAVSVFGNKKLCGGISELGLPRCIMKPSRSRFCTAKIVAVSIACALFVITMVCLFLFCGFRKKKTQYSLSFWLTRKAWCSSYDSLFKATNGFSSTNLVGVGSFGSVYRGFVAEKESFIAVKVLNLQLHGASKSFLAECRALANVRHRNLLKIITCCSSIDFQANDFKALVYEFMVNGSLDKWLHPVPTAGAEQALSSNLSLLQRINIAIDVANAIEYLHHHCHTPIIHCDLKPSNVLLDNDMVAHVGDFGLAKFLPRVTNSNQSSSVGIRGTIGYTAPEYGLGSEVSTAGDVYSYGILLLEMMTGKKPTDNLFKEGLNLHIFARMAVPEQVAKIIDPQLLNADVIITVDGYQAPRQDITRECLIYVVKIGVACSMESPQDRMDIRNAVKELHSIRDVLLGT